MKFLSCNVFGGGTVSLDKTSWVYTSDIQLGTTAVCILKYFLVQMVLFFQSLTLNKLFDEYILKNSINVFT